MKRQIHRLLLLSLILSLSLALFAQTKRGITETDLFKFNWIADPQISPDGSRVVFTKVWVNQKADRYDTALWIVSARGGDARQLTAGPRDSSPRWSPDGKTLAFIRSAEKEGRPQPPQIYLLTFDGGEAQPLTELSRGAGAFEWSPDGKTIVFLSTEEPKPAAKPGETATDKPADKPERVSDVRVINKATYRSNGPGYLNPKTHSHIWTVSVPATAGEMPKAKQLTKGNWDEGSVQFSPDGSRLYFIARRVAEAYYEQPHTDLYSIDLNGGDEKKVLSFDGGMRGYEFSRDGKRVAFGGTLSTVPVLSYKQPDLFVADLASGQVKNLTEGYDFDIGGGIGGDQSAPRGGGGSGAIWSADGNALIVNVAEHGRANLKRINAATGKVEALTTGDHAIQAYSATADASKMVCLISTSVNIHDLFLTDAATGKMTQLTDINKELFSQLNLTHPEEIWYTSFDGKKIQGWIQKPPSFDASKKYPFILEIHGGPHSAYGFTFTHEFQWMAAKDYVVLYTNPRGSTSYGQDFGNVIQYNYPGDDHKDLMLGVDEVLKRGYIDEAKLGITGGSGGGVLTNWAVGQTNRFKAAVSQRSISDWAGFWYTADFTLFQPTWFKAAPWEDPQDFIRRSPITNIAKVTTPMMFIEGEADWRTPPNEGGEQMFRALKYRKIPTVMVRFPNESHELSRSGAPWHRVERLQHIVNWFDKYLTGAPMKQYDIE